MILLKIYISICKYSMSASPFWLFCFDYRPSESFEHLAMSHDHSQNYDLVLDWASYWTLYVVLQIELLIDFLF